MCKRICKVCKLMILSSPSLDALGNPCEADQKTFTTERLVFGVCCFLSSSRDGFYLPSPHPVVNPPLPAFPHTAHTAHRAQAHTRLDLTMGKGAGFEPMGLIGVIAATIVFFFLIGYLAGVRPYVSMSLCLCLCVSVCVCVCLCVSGETTVTPTRSEKISHP